MTSDIESTSFVDSEDDDDDDDDLLNDTTVDDENDYEDYTSRVSTTTEETSVSRQYQRRNRHRNRRQKGGYRNRMSRVSLIFINCFSHLFYAKILSFVIFIKADIIVELNYRIINVVKYHTSHIEFGHC